jgi:alpha-mannosidase
MSIYLASDLESVFQASTDIGVKSCESLVRELLYGKDVVVARLPGSFGLNRQLPQFLSKSGIHYVITTSEMPERLFWWEALNGSRVLVYAANNSLVSDSCLELEIAKLDELYRRYGVNEYLALYDDPTGKQIEDIANVSRSCAFPEVRNTSIEFALESYAIRYGSELPVWRDTFSSNDGHAEDRRMSEVSLCNAEKLASLAWLQGKEYPQEELEQCWGLLNNENDETALSKTANRITGESFGIITEQIDTRSKHQPVVVFNTLGWPRTGEVYLDLTNNRKGAVYGPDGKSVPAQIVMRKDRPHLVFIARDVPSMGYKVYHIKYGAKPKSKGSVKAKRLTIENDYYLVVVNGITGNVSNIYDKKQQREVLAHGEEGNQYHLYDEAVNNGPVNLLSLNRTDSVALIEKGRTRSSIRVVHKTLSGKSTITTDIILMDGIARVDFESTLAWEEDGALLKVKFPVDVISDVATYDIAAGHMGHYNLPCNKAGEGALTSRWSDLSDGDFGVSLLTDGQCGSDTYDHVLSLSLLCSSNKGRHRFAYSIYSHAYDWRDGTIRQGYGVNCPLLVFETDVHSGKLPPVHSFLEISGGNAVLTTIKKPEDDEGWIVRFYESAGRHGLTRLTFPRRPLQAWRTNLLEEESRPLLIRGNTVEVRTGRYSIETVKVKF